MKRLNPSQRLLDEVKEFCNRLRYRREVRMWTYPASRLDVAWKLTDLKERVEAAKQLGYEVTIDSTPEGLEIWYVEKVKIPCNFL